MNKLDKIVRPNEFNADLIKLTPPRKNNDRTVVYLNYGEARNWAWETPWLRTPFGISSYQKGDTDLRDHSLPMQAIAKDSNEQPLVDNFFDQFRKLDQKVLHFTQKHSKMLLGKQFTEKQIEVVEVMCGKCVRSNEKYPDRISPKIPKKRGSNNVPEVIAFHGTPEPVQPSSFEEMMKLVPNNSFVKCIIRPRFWVVGGKCGVSLFMLQIVYPEDTGLDVGSTCGFDASTFKNKTKTIESTEKSEEADEADEDEDGEESGDVVDSDEEEEVEEDDDDDDDAEEEVASEE